VRGFGESMLGPRVLTIDPLVLADLANCDASSLESVQRCDPNANRVVDDNGNPVQNPKPLSDKEFFPRPVGGTSVAEASVELRFPVWRKITGAVFLDGAIVGQAAFERFGDFVDIASFTRGTAALTPGFGMRYHSRVGPIRIDFGYNPTISETQTVVTEVCGVPASSLDRCPVGEHRIVPLLEQRRLTGGRNLLERLTLHLSIGQAY
jgi:outer membrane protein assembly factor BamA